MQFNKVKILIIGLGSIGTRHLNNLLSLGYTNIIIYRTQKSTMKGIRKFFSFPIFYNLEDALAQRPNIAIIANPTSLHVSTALKCAKAGCHLFIEKPLSDNFARVQELNSIVQRKKLITFIGCQFRFHPHLMIIKRWIEDKTLGKVFYVSARWAEYLPDWHPWEEYRRGYSALKNLGGGVILTLIHPLDYMYWLFGEVSNIFCIKDKLSNLDIDVEDFAEIILSFKNKIIGHVHLDYFQKPRIHDMLIVAEKKKVYWNCHDCVLITESRKGKQIIQRDPKGFQRNTMFLDEMKHFLYCVKKRKQSLIPLKQGIEVLNIALKAKNKNILYE